MTLTFEMVEGCNHTYINELDAWAFVTPKRVKVPIRYIRCDKCGVILRLPKDIHHRFHTFPSSEEITELFRAYTVRKHSDKWKISRHGEKAFTAA